MRRPRPWKKATESSSRSCFALQSKSELSFDSFRFLARYFAWRKSKATSSMHFEKSRQSSRVFCEMQHLKSGFRRPDNKLHTQQWIWHHIQALASSLATTFASRELLYLDHYKRGALTLYSLCRVPKVQLSALLLSLQLIFYSHHSNWYVVEAMPMIYRVVKKVSN